MRQQEKTDIRRKFEDIYKKLFDGDILYVERELKLAAEQGYIENIINLRTLQFSPGGTFLDLASEKGFASVINCILQYNPDIYALDNKGKNSLQNAVYRSTKNLNKIEDYYQIFLSILNYEARIRASASSHNLYIDLPWLLSHKIQGKTKLLDIFFYIDDHSNVRKKLIEIAFESLKFYKQKLKEDKSILQYKSLLLQQAIEENLDDISDNIVSSNFDLEFRSINNETALHIATKKKNINVIKKLVTLGADVKARNWLGNTAFHIAIAVEEYDITEYFLLLDKSLLDIRNNQGETALHWAAKEEDEKYIKLLLKYGANILTRDPLGQSILHYAAEMNRINTLRFLLEEKHFNIETKDNENRTALFNAGFPKNEAYQYLLSKGADLQNSGIYGSTHIVDRGYSLHDAVHSNNKEEVKKLLELGANTEQKNDRGSRPIHIAATFGYDDMLTILLEHGADIDGRDDQYWTPLCCASAMSKSSTVELLLNKGAEPDYTTDKVKNNSSPLHLAVSESHNERIVKLLLDNKANKNAQDKKSRTALNLALEQKDYKIVDSLLNHNVDVNLADKEGITPLHILAKTDQFKLIDRILLMGANIEAKDKDDWTPLHFAAISKSPVLKMLIEKGANLEAKDSEGRTPIHIAAMSQNLEAAKILVENGANINALDNKGKNAMMNILDNPMSNFVEIFKNISKSKNKEKEEELFAESESNYIDKENSNDNNKEEDNKMPSFLNQLLEKGKYTNLRKRNFDQKSYSFTDIEMDKIQTKQEEKSDCCIS